MNQHQINPVFWHGKSVLVTGNTGFKGSWLSLWLAEMGAMVHGYAIAPQTRHSMHELMRTHEVYGTSTLNDIRDRSSIHSVLYEQQPEIVFHLAAQSLVRESYTNPVDTFATNVMGTVNVLDAVSKVDSVKSVVIITSDKCYENKEWEWGYRENEPLGGHDPYSASKACTELVAQSWQKSFLEDSITSNRTCAVATARAGNVIGGGDWSRDRLIPDVLASIDAADPIVLRNPDAVRPWQHVLEPLAGYLLLAEKLYKEGDKWAEAWNFGPADSDVQKVSAVVESLIRALGSRACWQHDTGTQPAEAQLLRLDCSKARQRLAWKPLWDLQRALEEIALWHRAWHANEDMQAVSIATIERYIADS